ARRAGEAAVLQERRERALAAVADAWAGALDAWGDAWLRVQRAGLERRTQAALLAEYARLEAELRAYTHHFHADVAAAYAEAAALAEAGAHPNLVQSREHDVEMRLHHFHAFVADVRDGFLAALRAHTP